MSQSTSSNRSKRHGKVSRGWLGVQIQEVTPAIAASLGLGGEGGALVANVTPNSPAARAGLKQGDVILSFNNTDLKQMRDLPRLVSTAEPDAAAPITVWRNGQRKELSVTLGEAPENLQTASVRGSETRRGGQGRGARHAACRADPRSAPAAARRP